MNETLKSPAVNSPAASCGNCATAPAPRPAAPAPAVNPPAQAPVLKQAKKRGGRNH